MAEARVLARLPDDETLMAYVDGALPDPEMRRIEEIVQTEAKIRARGLPKDAANLKRLKAMGFSDKRLGELVGLSEDKVRSHRHKLAVRPVYKRIDTCAAEFASPTAYMYSTYDAENEARPSDRAGPRPSPRPASRHR